MGALSRHTCQRKASTSADLHLARLLLLRSPRIKHFRRESSQLRHEHHLHSERTARLRENVIERGTHWTSSAMAKGAIKEGLDSWCAITCWRTLGALSSARNLSASSTVCAIQSAMHASMHLEHANHTVPGCMKTPSKDLHSPHLPHASDSLRNNYNAKLCARE